MPRPPVLPSLVLGDLGVLGFAALLIVAGWVLVRAGRRQGEPPEARAPVAQRPQPPTN